MWRKTFEIVVLGCGARSGGIMFVVVRKEMVSADSSHVTSPSSSYLHAGMAAHYEEI